MRTIVGYIATQIIINFISCLLVLLWFDCRQFYVMIELVTILSHHESMIDKMLRIKFHLKSFSILYLLFFNIVFREPILAK